jgi:hypothetical protein
MKLTIFGLTISSSWGNGHATLWRGLIGPLARRGRVVSFERDAPYDASTRDLAEIPGGQLRLYRDRVEAWADAERELAGSDTALERIAAQARERVLAERTADRRAEEFETLVFEPAPALAMPGPIERGSLLE